MAAVSLSPISCLFGVEFDERNRSRNSPVSSSSSLLPSTLLYSDSSALTRLQLLFAVADESIVGISDSSELSSSSVVDLMSAFDFSSLSPDDLCLSSIRSNQVKQ